MRSRHDLPRTPPADVLNVSDAFVLGLLNEGRIPCRVDGGDKPRAMPYGHRP